MFCHNCGTALRDGTRFCAKCGSAQPVLAPTPVAPPRPAAPQQHPAAPT